MNELQVFVRNNSEVVDSRDVALMIGRPHNDLMKSIRVYAEFISNAGNFSLVDFFIPNTYRDSKGEIRPCYLLTKKGCDMVANKMTGEKGVLFTAAYVTAFEKMRQQTALNLPKDYPSALRALADAEEKRMALEAKVEEDRPKVLFADSVSASKDSILVRELATILKQNGVSIGQNRLFAWLRENGYLVRRRGSDYNTPTQKSMELGLFEIKETVINHADGTPETKKGPRVTGRGQQYFVERFLSGKGDAV